jgi:cold shock CspA family protein
MRGRVTAFNSDRGFGFVDRGDGSRNSFFHITAAQYLGPAVGDVVEFEEGELRQGRIRAEAVRLVERAKAVA